MAVEYFSRKAYWKILMDGVEFHMEYSKLFPRHRGIIIPRQSLAFERRTNKLIESVDGNFTLALPGFYNFARRLRKRYPTWM